MGWYYDNFPLVPFLDYQEYDILSMAKKKPLNEIASPCSIPEVHRIQIRRESILFSIGPDRRIPHEDIFDEIHKKVPRIDLNHDFDYFTQKMWGYKESDIIRERNERNKNSLGNEIEVMFGYNQNRSNELLSLLKIGIIDCRMLSFDRTDVKFNLEFTFHYVVDHEYLYKQCDVHSDTKNLLQ